MKLENRMQMKNIRDNQWLEWGKHLANKVKKYGQRPWQPSYGWR